MSFKVEKTDKKNEVKLELTVEAKRFEEAINTVYAKNSKYFAIPGFRKVKAPMKMVEKQYGVEIFYEDAFNEVAPVAMEEAIETEKLEVVSKPEIDIKQMEKGKDLIFTAVVQTKPEVKLGKYKGVEIKKIEYKADDHDIEHELGHMQERNARLITVDDRPVKKDDTAVIDFEGFVDGVAFEGGKAENHELVIGSNTFIPGFEDQIIGMKIDEEKDIKVKFPDEYFSKDLAGKDAVFKVKLHEIKVKEMPKLDDEFAKDVSEFDTLEELKNSIKEKLEEENKNRAKHETEDAAIQAVCDGVEVDIPSGMIETEIDNAVRDIETRLSYQGLKLDQYLQMMGKTMAEFRKEYEEQASKSVKTRLVLEAVSKEAKIEPLEEEINDKIKEMAEHYGKKEEELKENEQLKNYVIDSLKSEKTVQFIVDNAKIK